MLVAMRRVDVVAPRARAAALLRALHRSGSVHLLPFTVPPGAGELVFRPGHEPQGASRLEVGLERAAELQRLLGEAEPPAALLAELWQLDDDALLRRLDALEPIQTQARAIAAERVRLLAQQTRTQEYRSLVEGLQGIADRLPAIHGYATTAIVIQPRYRHVLALLRDELEALTGGRCELIAADLSGDRVGAALLYPAAQMDAIRALLGGRDLEELPLPAEFVGLPFRELEPRLSTAIEQLREQVAATEADLRSLGERVRPVVAALAAVLRDRSAEVAALREAGSSDHLVLISGWVPGDRLAELRSTVEREVGTEAVVIDRAPTRSEAAAVPVAFENRPLLRPFEGLASFVAVPRYGSIDPTPFLAMTLPIFIGLMVGDVGYGLVLLAALAWARRRWPRSSLVSAVLPVGLLAAGSTIVFGFLFGEAFGNIGARLLGMPVIWLDRREAAIDFLALAIAIGAAQVVLGLVLGVVNGVILRQRETILSRAALLVGLAAIAGLLGWVAGPLPSSLGYLAAAALVTALAVLVATLGLAGPIELIGAVGNVLSYARLMAIGLASVMLALVANELGDLAGNLLVGATVALLLHALNIGLGFFDSSIQGLRLHYVEFFTKFVEPGGVRFAPFTSALAMAGGPFRPAAAGGV